MLLYTRPVGWDLALVISLIGHFCSFYRHRHAPTYCGEHSILWRFACWGTHGHIEVDWPCPWRGGYRCPPRKCREQTATNPGSRHSQFNWMDEVQVTTEDFLRQSINNILAILRDPPAASTLPSLQAGDNTTNAIQQIADLLNSHCKWPVHIPPTPVI